MLPEVSTLILTGTLVRLLEINNLNRTTAIFTYVATNKYEEDIARKYGFSYSGSGNEDRRARLFSGKIGNVAVSELDKNAIKMPTIPFRKPLFICVYNIRRSECD